MDARQANPVAGQNVRLPYSLTDGLDGKALLPVSGALFWPEGTAPQRG
ncbi:hypothetical protein [Sphingorhabdus sp. EL138]|nr:hypothetical protein [Sphingorhabdus sp. EL138]